MKQKNIRIAIADNHTMFRQGLVSSLKPYCHIEILFDAANGVDLIALLSTAKQLPDICILDIPMKTMNGYETANAIRGKWSAIKTIALTMLDHEYCIINMLRNGARGYITKGQDTGVLLNALENVYTYGFHYDDIDAETLSRALHGESIYPSLTSKEKEFLHYCCSDLTYRDIADKMCVSHRTVEAYRDSLCLKFNVKTRIGLTTFAIYTGLVNY